MDVRCERCRAQYVFDDDQVTPAGLTVQCTNCGHLFRVKKKELVVTVPVKPEDLGERPLLASAASLRSRDEERPREFQVRQAGGGTLSFAEMTTLQKWIVERRVTRDDELAEGGAWVRLGVIPELAAFFDVVEAADRAKAPPRSSTTAPYPSPFPSAPSLPLPPFPPPSFAPASPARSPVPPAPASTPPAATPIGRLTPSGTPRLTTAELDAAEVAALQGNRRGLALAAVVLVGLAGAAAAYVLAPSLFARPTAPPAPPPPAPVAVPITIEMKGPPEPPPPAAEVKPPPSPEPAGSPAPAASPRSLERPEPTPAARPKAEPAGPRQRLALAQKLRESGQVEKALDLFGRIVSDEPENVEALTGRGLCYLDLGQYHPAEASFQGALAVSPGQADALMGLAETYRSQGKKAEAVQAYERYLALHPDGEEAAVARNAVSQLKE